MHFGKSALHFSTIFKKVLPYSAFVLVSLKSVSCTGEARAMATGSASQKSILLYNDPPSYYGQKVTLTLHEKGIPFAMRSIDIFNGENYQDWYLKLNPRGEVPVIQDGDEVIPDSKRIIDYLEDKYSDGKFIRLTPLDLGENVTKKVNELRGKLDEVDGNLIAFGTLFHEEHVQNTKFPFQFSVVRQKMKQMVESMGSRLRALAETHPNASEVLLAKAERADGVRDLVMDKDRYQLELNKVASLLEQIEKQLMYRTPDTEGWWLCCERFTQADVSLTVLLYRLSIIGLEEWLWGSLPYLKEYYRRVQERPTFKKTFPTMAGFVWDKVMEYKFYILGGLSLIIVVIALLVYFLKGKVKEN